MRLHQVFAVLAVALGASSARADEPAPKPVRVLIVTTNVSREFHFVRTALVREVQDKRAELSTFVQNDAGVNKITAEEGETIPTRFPNLLRPADKVKAEDKPYNLNSYDVVIAFDLDWTQVEPESLILLQKWVERGGGLIVLAGPVHTPKVAAAKPDDAVLQSVRELLPVVPSAKPPGPAASTPARLTFNEAKPVPSFLKLDPKGKSDLAGWAEFFGAEKDGPPDHGFYACFPVDSVKKGAVTLATFETPGGKERPWLATHTVGKGRVVWMGSAELYRMRSFGPDAGTGREYFERFWLGLTHHVSLAGSAGAPRSK